jgi:EF hand
MNTIKRFSIGFLFATAGFATSTLALADAPKAEKQCDGHGKGQRAGKGGLFKKADKNKDGFLTKDEVGDQRWERIKAADANNDGKVSQPEMKQARKDGKLPHGPGKKA